MGNGKNSVESAITLLLRNRNEEPYSEISFSNDVLDAHFSPIKKEMSPHFNITSSFLD